jgi:molybdenum cofactor cytidylyltransferase
MIAAEDTVLVLLAAGKSVRFGSGESKLDQPLGDHPLGLHAVIALGAIPFRAHVAVVSRCRIDYAALGYAMIENDDPVGDMASSLRLGVGWAQEHGAAAVLVALADMPQVTAAHVRRLLDAADGSDAVVASASPDVPPRPPAVFGRGLFAHLLSLSGDHGARDLIRAGRHVQTLRADLIDIDTQEELEALRSRPSFGR